MGSRTPATGGTPAQASPLRAHGSVAAAAPRRETRLMRWSLAMGSRTKTEVRRAHDGVRKHRSFHGDVLRALRGVETDGGRGDSERATDAAESGPIGDVSQRPSVGRTLSQRLFARGTTHPASPEHRRGMAHLPKSATLVSGGAWACVLHSAIGWLRWRVATIGYGNQLSHAWSVTADPAPHTRARRAQSQSTAQS